MRSWVNFVAAAVMLALPACYHQVVETGAVPGPVMVEKPWTATYIFGLVPAAAINTAAECPAGVAVVDTQQSFANGLVGVLTLGIYTPQTVTITCAASGNAMATGRRVIVAADASRAEKESSMQAAIDLSRVTGETVVIYSMR